MASQSVNNKVIPTEVQGERVLIRRLRFGDAEAVYRNCKSASVARWTLALPHPYPKNAAAKFISRTHRKWRAGKEYHMGIILRDENVLAGVLGLRNVDKKHHTAELGCLLGEKYWGQGLATEATGLAIRFGFEYLNLYRIYACFFEPNIASGRVLKKCGLVREGVWREAIVKHGRRRNIVHCAILKPEYEKQLREKVKMRK
jgi:ribosomal-protein-alanine N-acetyltransferase